MKQFVAKNGFRAKALVGAVVLAGLVPAAGALANASDPTAKLTAAEVEKGRGLFNDWSCGACHTLGDAKASGSIGPSFDGDTRLDHPFTVDRITNGQGAMPAFGGQMTDEEIDLLARYIVQSKK